MNILNDLGAAPAANETPGASPELPALDAKAPPVPDGPLKVLRGVSSGQIPGVVVPKGTPEIASGLKPEDLHQFGVDLYIPKSGDYVGVLFNPQHISEKMLQGMDKAGKLGELPSIDKLLGSDSGDSGASADAGPTPSADSDLGPSGMAPVQILPRSGLSSDAQGSLENSRLKALTTEPSKRTIPGAGSVLNGLVNRAI